MTIHTRAWSGLAALYGAALGLFALHGLYHFWQWLWWPPPDALQVLYGHSELGRWIHVATESIIAMALLVAALRELWT